MGWGQSHRGRARIGDDLDLDVRRPLSKRGTLEALQRGSNQPVVGARCHSNAAAKEKEGPLPSLVPVFERPCSALRLGGGMILALDHLLVRLLIIIQPWIGTQALGHRHFGHPPPLGHLQHIRGLFRVGVQSSQVESFLFLLPCWGRLQTVSQADRGRGRSRAEAGSEAALLINSHAHRSSRLAQAHGDSHLLPTLPRGPRSFTRMTD